jgi:hypothetical protein
MRQECSVDRGELHAQSTRLCVFVCVCEREREREIVCLCLCVCERESVCAEMADYHRLVAMTEGQSGRRALEAHLLRTSAV